MNAVTRHTVRWKGLTILAAILLACVLTMPADAGESEAISFVPPANDTCAGAQVIPPSGPFPYLTTTVDISSATTAGDPAPSCQPSWSGGIWFSFTPTTTATFTFSTCEAVAPGTTRSDTVLALYNATAGACPQGSEIACDDDDNLCAGHGLQSTLAATLTAGTRYFLVAYSWGNPPVGAIQVAVAMAPPNDLCNSAPALTVGIPVNGTTTAAANDYRLNGSACYTGVGQSSSAAQGRDVGYAFTAPSAGPYSFRLTRYGAGNPVLYVASSCPNGVKPIAVTSCLAAANRSAGPAEETMCVPLASGQTVYAFVDETSQTNGGPFTLEVERCVREVEPNDAPATGTALSCGIEGSITPGGDPDFFRLGIPNAGDRVFALADSIAANGSGGNTLGGDFRLRVTTNTDTLEADDDDGDGPSGGRAPAVAGTPLPGSAAYLRIDALSPTQPAEPYALYYSVQPAIQMATPESEPNNSTAQADSAPNEYFSGALSGPAPSTDSDVYIFAGGDGDLIFLSLDGDPLRDGTPLNAKLELLDASGAVLISVNDTNAASDTTPSPGSLAGTTPNSPSESLVYRAPAAGVFYARVSSGTASAVPSGAGDYLLSISKNCQTATGADLGIAMTAAPEPVATRSTLTYTISVTNAGPGAALDPQVHTATPSGTTFISAGGSGWACATPAVGGTGTVTCTLGALSSGATSVLTLAVRIDQCLGAGALIAGAATLTSTSNDPNSANDAASATSTTVDDGGCEDGNACTTGDTCSGATCVGGAAANCDDGNLCTDDSCSPVSGCLHAFNSLPCADGNACTANDICILGSCSGGAPPNCDDGNACTDDSCAPASGCVHANNSTSCNDGDRCTVNDACGGGVCVPGGPRNCDDANFCTNDSCDSIEGCINNPRAGPCDDASACTTGDTCSGAACVGTPLDCDDHNACTNDACSALTGCVNTNNSAPCNDGNVCTTADACGGGVCQPGVLNTDPCDDGNACTAGDRCAAGVCVPGGPRDCNDHNACTDDSCSVALGCQNPANTAPCDDGNPCTSGDACSAGVCGAGAPNSDPCDDGSACTTNDHCGGGTCSAGTPLDCDDADSCTVDACNPASGCTHASGDADGDGWCDLQDNCPTTPNANQANSDSDAAGNVCDCAPLDGSVYSVPSEARSVLLHGAVSTKIEWSPPAAAGGSQVVYDLLRSTVAADFMLTEPDGQCLAEGIIPTVSADQGPPPPVGHAWYYLVRAMNACGGNLGTASSGAPRSGRTCP